MQCCAPAGADRIERLLSLGASRAEATRDLLGRAVRLAMTPLLNQMSVVGLVSIPGMMTGQILGGSHPDQAARCARVDWQPTAVVLHACHIPNVQGATAQRRKLYMHAGPSSLSCQGCPRHCPTHHSTMHYAS
jgi:hypothetical protein